MAQTQPLTLSERILREVIGAGFQSSDQYSRRLTQYPKGMNEFISTALGVELWAKQREIVESIERHPRTAVRSSHAVGKSFVAARIVLAFLHTRPNSIVITTAPSYTQVRNVLWRYIRAATETTRMPLLGKPLMLEYQISADWYAMGFMGSDKNQHIMQGFHAEDLLLVVDEAAGVHENVLQASEAILTGSGARSLLIGNPTSMSGTFRRAFHQDQHLYNTITVSAYDTPNFTTFGITRDDMLTGAWEEKIAGQQMPQPGLVDPYWVNRQIQLFGADSSYVKTRVDAEFADDEENTLLSLATIETAEANATLPDPSAPIVAGIDVARSGYDETVIAVRQGVVLRHLEWWRGQDLMESTGRVRHVLERYGGTTVSDIRVDVIGLGAGLADRLRELGYNVTDVNVSVRSSDPAKWPNLRHEAWWQLKELFEGGHIVPELGHEFDDMLKSQLSDVKYFYGSTHTMPQIESKELSKRRTGRSPDRAEAVLMAFLTMPPKKRQPSTVLAVSRTKSRWG